MGIKMGKLGRRVKSYDHILIVMRHAKAEPFGPEGDRSRPLAGKGLKQAKTVGKGLLGLKLVPGRIACSAAVRTRQTCARMLRSFGDVPVVDYRQGLYDGGIQAVLDELACTKDKVRALLVIGHEPTVSIASQWIASADSDPATIGLLNLGMSPASIAVFGSDKPFAQWQIHSGDLLAVINPKDFE